MNMIRSHHITAELAREHQCDLLVAARGARGDRALHDDVEAAGAIASAHHGVVSLRNWRGRRSQPRTAAPQAAAEPRPLGRCA